ncbi:MAG: hypothetical protein AAF320_05560 [Myxococcota bacterium]
MKKGEQVVFAMVTLVKVMKKKLTLHKKVVVSVFAAVYLCFAWCGCKTKPSQVSEPAAKAVVVGTSPRSQFVEDLMGFQSVDFTQARRENAIRKGTYNGQDVYFITGKDGAGLQGGYFEVLSIGALRNRSGSIHEGGGKLHVREGQHTRDDSWFHVCLDVAALQADHPGAVFQVASNSNALETVSHTQNISTQPLESYAFDKTQGPAASISAASGLLVRRYYPFYNAATPVDAWQQKPSGSQQVNFLQALTADRSMPSDTQLAMSPAGYVYLPIAGVYPSDEHIARMGVGVHRDVQVTYGHSLPGGSHEVLSWDKDNRVIVHQVFTAAADLGQGTNVGKEDSAIAQAWAKAILRANYEGTLRAAAVLGAKRVFLTLVGGGVFGNEPAWIVDAIAAMQNFLVQANLDVTVIVYSRGDVYREALSRLVQQTGGTYTLYTAGVPPAGLPRYVVVKKAGPDC